VSRATGPAERSWTEERVERLLGNVLRAGVLLSALVVVIGGVAHLAGHGTEPADYGAFTGEPAGLTGARAVVRTALSLSGAGIIQLGLLILIATPVARVAFAVAAFARGRDWLYVVVSLIVLAVLVAALTGLVA